jgi:hypothetical protein
MSDRICAMIATGAYLGGIEGLAPRADYLVLRTVGIAVGLGASPQATVAWSNVASVEVTSAQRAKSKLVPTLAFGIFGLAAKGSEDVATMILHLKSGEHVYFQARRMDTTKLKAKIAPCLTVVGVPFYVEQQQRAVGPDLADQLSRLSELHASGTLTAEEFEAAKARVIGN